MSSRAELPEGTEPTATSENIHRTTAAEVLQRLTPDEVRDWFTEGWIRPQHLAAAVDYRRSVVDGLEPGSDEHATQEQWLASLVGLAAPHFHEEEPPFRTQIDLTLPLPAQRRPGREER